LVPKKRTGTPAYRASSAKRQSSTRALRELLGVKKKLQSLGFSDCQLSWEIGI
jgi:hypothetical protein